MQWQSGIQRLESIFIDPLPESFWKSNVDILLQALVLHDVSPVVPACLITDRVSVRSNLFTPFGSAAMRCRVMVFREYALVPVCCPLIYKYIGRCG